MVEGRLRKEFFQQVVLLQQTFLGAGGDGKATVEQFLKERGEDRRRARSRSPSSCATRWARASRRRTSDFAAEVAKAAGRGAEGQRFSASESLRVSRDGEPRASARRAPVGMSVCE